MERRNVAERGWGEPIKRSGLDDPAQPLTMHSLRDTFASHLILDLALDVVQVSRELGDSKPSIPANNVRSAIRPGPARRGDSDSYGGERVQCGPRSRSRPRGSLSSPLVIPFNGSVASSEEASISSAAWGRLEAPDDRNLFHVVPPRFVHDQ
jgi:hypothetical protein